MVVPALVVVDLLAVHEVEADIAKAAVLEGLVGLLDG